MSPETQWNLVQQSVSEVAMVVMCLRAPNATVVVGDVTWSLSSRGVCGV